MQLREAVAREDYADAVKLKLAISTAEKNDTVGTALSDLRVRIKHLIGIFMILSCVGA